MKVSVILLIMLFLTPVLASGEVCDKGLDKTLIQFVETIEQIPLTSWTYEGSHIRYEHKKPYIVIAVYQSGLVDINGKFINLPYNLSQRIKKLYFRKKCVKNSDKDFIINIIKSITQEQV